ncbi:MAG: hypothetical protein KJ550_03030 [Proteobacteria bacterium]|nr:hypothetical protein [Pseudomonadota bacterium]MBU4067950.1 hypothetical protein [Pseudomonadota bacterium]
MKTPIATNEKTSHLLSDVFDIFFISKKYFTKKSISLRPLLCDEYCFAMKIISIKSYRNGYIGIVKEDDKYILFNRNYSATDLR